MPPLGGLGVKSGGLQFAPLTVILFGVLNKQKALHHPSSAAWAFCL